MSAKHTRSRDARGGEPRDGEPAPRYSLVEILEILGTSPSRIAAATAAMSPDALHRPLEPAGWSVRDILGHIRACNQTWGGYISRILEEDEPSFRAESPRSTIRRTDFLEQSFHASLEAFTTDRGRLVQRLHALDIAAFTRTAVVTIPARGVEPRTALYYADRLAGHEREHVRHIERSMKAGSGG